MKLTHKQIPVVREHLIKEQGGACPLCKGSIREASTKDAVLDHCHTTGYIRSALCRNCNRSEGKVKTAATMAKHKLTPLEWLQNLVAYHERHAEPQHGGLIHPTFKTEAEKRLARNAKAQKKRAALKAK